MQLGFLGALTETIAFPYRMMPADILISASDSNTLSDGSNVPRQRMYQALATPGVADANPLFLGKFDWHRPTGDTINFHVFGIDPANPALRPKNSTTPLNILKLADIALADAQTRGIEPTLFAEINAGKPIRFEANGRTIELAGTFETGASFDADGFMITSDQTFLRMFPKRFSRAPSHILVNVSPGERPEVVVERLRQTLPSKDTIVRTLKEAVAMDQKYQTTEKPVGVIFGFGVIIGILVGIIIVYQVLSTDVADHLAEYATLKAIGYRQSFFLSIVFEEALILAFFGFIPGVILSLGLYKVVSAATFLPVAMTGTRAVLVLAGTVLMCMLSGAIATRRLANADPADLF